MSLDQRQVLVQGLVHLPPHHFLESDIDLATTVLLQGPIGGRDMVEQEKPQNNGHKQSQNGNDPHDQREEHGKHDDGLQAVLVTNDLDIVDELAKGSVSIMSYKRTHLHDRIKSDGVHHLSRAIREDRSHPSYSTGCELAYDALTGGWGEGTKMR